MESARSFSVGSCRPQLGAVWLLFLILLHSHLIWELWDFELHTDEWRKLVPLFPSWVHKECSDQCYRFATYSLYLCWHVFHLLLVPSILFFFLAWSILNLQVFFCIKVNMYIYVIGHIYWFEYVEPTLDLWDETNWLWCFQYFFVSLFFFYLKTKSLKCTSCLPACVYMHHVCLAPLEDRIGYQTLWNQS